MPHTLDHIYTMAAANLGMQRTARAQEFNRELLLQREAQGQPYLTFFGCVPK